MERALEGDDFILFRAEMFPGVTPGQLERGLVGLATGIGKEHTFGKGQITQGLGQPQGRLVCHDIRQVPDFFGLLHQSTNKAGMIMPEAGHRNAARQVDVFLTLLIPYVGAFTLDGNHRPGCIVGDHYLIEQLTADRFSVHRCLSNKT